MFRNSDISLSSERKFHTFTHTIRFPTTYGKLKGGYPYGKSHCI